jgi:hypothetical protein
MRWGDPGCVRHVDGPIAVVWSRYKFTVRYAENWRGPFSSTLRYRDVPALPRELRWKIVNFADIHSDEWP